MLLACAVYELAGARAATVSAWILAFEPAGIFFSGLLHKEALLVLAEGLVVWGGACLWRRGRTSYAWAMALGCLVALGARPYVGWFLIAGSLAIMLHAAARVRGDSSRRSATLIALVALVAVLGAPFAVQKSSSSGLKDYRSRRPRTRPTRRTSSSSR